MNDFAECRCQTKVILGLTNLGMKNTIDVQEQHRREIKVVLSRIRMQSNKGYGRSMGRDHFLTSGMSTITAFGILQVNISHAAT